MQYGGGVGSLGMVTFASSADLPDSRVHNAGRACRRALARPGLARPGVSQQPCNPVGFVASDAHTRDTPHRTWGRCTIPANLAMKRSWGELRRASTHWSTPAEQDHIGEGFRERRTNNASQNQRWSRRVALRAGAGGDGRNVAGRVHASASARADHCARSERPSLPSAKTDRARGSADRGPSRSRSQPRRPHPQQRQPRPRPPRQQRRAARCATPAPTSPASRWTRSSSPPCGAGRCTTRCSRMTRKATCPPRRRELHAEPRRPDLDVQDPQRHQVLERRPADGAGRGVLDPAVRLERVDQSRGRRTSSGTTSPSPPRTTTRSSTRR